MPTLVIDNVPASLYDRIHDLARTQRRTAADTALDVLAHAFEVPTPNFADVSIPWPDGELVVPIEIREYLPMPHDILDSE